MNPESIRRVNDTIGVLERVKDALPNAIGIIENLMQQNQAMHGVMKQENLRLREEIRLAGEEKEKLQQSEKARRKALDEEIKGRETDSVALSELESRFGQLKEKCARITKEKRDAELEKASAKAQTNIVQEQLGNALKDNDKLQRQLDAAQDIENQVKANATNKQALLEQQAREMAEQTDTAQSAKRKDDVELENLKLQLVGLTSMVKILKNILNNSPNIDENTRKQLLGAMATNEPKGDGLKHKIKF
jgi:chromosome segregation ATPase